MKKITKNEVFAFLLGILTVSGGTVYAAALIAARDVSYDNSTSDLNSTNAQEALDELYDKVYSIKSKCPEGYICIKIED